MLNEFRRDPISGDWVLFDTGRKKNHIRSTEPFRQPIEGCFFENPVASNNMKPEIVYAHGVKVPWTENVEWTTMVIGNKFPALAHGVCVEPRTEGLFQVADAHGFHNLVITRDHDKNFSNFTDTEVAEILQAYQDQYLAMRGDSCSQFISIFHNKGPAAGATVSHNHSQMVSLPVIPPGIHRSLQGAEDYYVANNHTGHSALIEWESAQKKRIVYENEAFIAMCPYISKLPYQVKLFPKVGSPRFENISAADRILLANALNTVLKKIISGLGDPDFNYYVHTAPVKPNTRDYDSYCWHIEIIPRVKIVGGLELGTDVYANEIDPDEAAELFRNASV